MIERFAFPDFGEGGPSAEDGESRLKSRGGAGPGPGS